MGIGNYDTASTLLTEAIKQNPSLPDLYISLATAYWKNHLENKAFQIANDGLENFFGDFKFEKWYLGFMGSINKLDNAILFLSGENNKENVHERLPIVLANLLISKNENELAVEILNK